MAMMWLDDSYATKFRRWLIIFIYLQLETKDSGGCAVSDVVAVVVVT